LSQEDWQRYGESSGQVSGYGHFHINPPQPPFIKGGSGGIEEVMENSVLLQLNNISVVYSDVIQVLKGVSLIVKKGQIVSLLGSNGAGKTTTLKAISGLLKPENGKVTEGTIYYDGQPIQNSAPEKITRLGIIQVLEGRQPFKYLTVEENLRVGTATRWGKPFKKDLELVYHYFPPLAARRKRLAGYCSGGELQMLVLGRALMAHPKLLLLDEPSLGLAPVLVKDIFGIVKRINEEQKTTLILVEQNANMALQIAHYGYVMENGKIVLEETAKNLRENPDIKEFYLGTMASGVTKSYRDVKSYKRRKRWL
jgi:branched-chain amino acid transport system ATP-binding protein